MKNYDDIINLPAWNPKRHPRMALVSRAAQFAPFAALVGHDEAIKETARHTSQDIVPDNFTAQILNNKINHLITHIGECPQIEISYFVPDTKKSGGSIATCQGVVRMIDEVVGSLIFTDGKEIKLDAVRDMRGQIFDDFDC